jgi:hypothetical protein
MPSVVLVSMGLSDRNVKKVRVGTLGSAMGDCYGGISALEVDA